MKFLVDGINCQNCANTIKNALEDDYGAIEIDLACEPKTLEVQLKVGEVDKFKSELEELGFSVIKEL